MSDAAPQRLLDRQEIEVWWTAGAQFAIEHEPAAG